MPTRAFDTEAPRGTLKRFHPDMTEVVDITTIPDQMKIFDTLAEADAKVTMIDVRAGLLSSTLKALRDIGFLDIVKKGQVTFAVFHILGPSIASLDEIAETAAFVGDAKYFLVKNHINNTNFFEWDPATYDSYFRRIKGAVEISIPQLNEMACEQVELASVPFLTFVANKNAGGEAASYSFVLRGYVRHWLGNVWGEYDRVKLTEISPPNSEALMPGRVASRTPLFIVCSPQARVGRTLVARLLMDFFLMEDRPVAGFDFEAEPPALDRFPARPNCRASVADIGGQMALFDRLIVPDRIAKVVDLAPASFQQFFSVMARDRLHRRRAPARDRADRAVHRRARRRLPARLCRAAAQPAGTGAGAGL